jgi:hypothetical protein
MSKGTPLVFDPSDCLGAAQPPGLDTQKPLVSDHIAHNRIAWAQQFTYYLCRCPHNVRFARRSTEMTACDRGHLV